MIDLHDFRKNEFSQHGEDGIIARLFEEMGVQHGTFCEFGAWDGKHLSNSYALYQRGWSGVYIEGDPTRFADLRRNITREDMDLICAFVTPEGETTLDNLMGNSRVINETGRLDLLSIDIDSDDLVIFQSVKKLRATVVVIEYNPTIPLELDYVNPRGENKGNSARSILRTAESNGYVLVAVTMTNLVLVDRNALPSGVKTFGIADFDLFPGPRYFFGYDGTLITSRGEGGRRIVLDRELVLVPWKMAFFTQPVPKMFRHFSQRKFMDKLLLAYCAVVSLVTNPLGFLREGHRLYNLYVSKIR